MGKQETQVRVSALPLTGSDLGQRLSPPGHYFLNCGIRALYSFYFSN